MMQRLLAGLRVLDLGHDAGARAGRVLGDLGAQVVRVVPPEGDPLGGNVARAWNAGKQVLTLASDDAALDALLADADVVIDEIGRPGTHHLDPTRAPHAVWVRISPFGGVGPRAGWNVSDLGVMAASGNMYATGDPDRAPIRCTEPTAYAHSGPEAAFAAMTALASGLPQRVDVSMQEVVAVANMVAVAGFADTGARGSRRGANIGRTREIWPTLDGFVSFGLRGGKARIPSLEILTKLVAGDGVPGADALVNRDWSTFNQNTASNEELAAIESAVAAYFAGHTMQELYDIAVESNLMLAPANSPREIYQSAQLAARDFFGPVGDIARFPRSVTVTRSPGDEVEPVRPAEGALVVSAASFTAAGLRPSGGTSGRRAGDGLKIIEFGSGAAGPIATRYFVENGATVLRVESKTRPDFLRAYAMTPDNPHGLEGSAMYDGLNVGKRNVALNLKQPEAVALVKRLVVEWADAVAENYAPRAMKGFGLDYDVLSAIKPSLVMISACLNGQTGPHKDYPGFGGQGSALGGYNALTGWADREPIGPYGTITDSLAPRYVAAALAAGLLYQRRTGKGVYLDIAQVETAHWSLSPWLLDYELDDVIRLRDGNRHPHAAPHGAFPCLDEGDVGDRWIAIACWSDDAWPALAERLGLADDARLASLAGRKEHEDEIEAGLSSWTATRTRADVAQELQAVGIEAVPVQDFGDLHEDPQLALRNHFEPHTHAFLGPRLYERNGFRLSDSPGGYDQSGPTLGQDREWVLHEVLGCTDAEVAALRESGAVE
jgi:crotonobetainyl-CoA:carnitine CoA-transferase CaiB-like acyl-CoA transferase